MKISQKVLVFLLAGSPMSVHACPVLSEPAQIERDRLDRIEVSELVHETAKRSDLIFVGRVRELSEEKYEVPTDDGPHEMIRHRPTFDVITMLKGSSVDVDGVAWNQDPLQFRVGCTLATFFYHVDLMKTYRYLIYAKDGEILQATEVVDWPNSVPYDEQIKLIQGK